jgi:O-antigen/teichoic acid export membrane protein
VTDRAGLLRKGGSAASVASSQFAVAGANYLLLALAARHVGAAGFAVLTSYYLLVNTVGRGVFAAVELETTRSVAHARATGVDDTAVRRAALRQTGLLLVAVAVLIVLAAPLTGPVFGSELGSLPAALGLLGLGALAMAASYLLRGPLAGHRRYGLYAGTFWIEAGAGAVAAIVLALAGVTSTTAWVAVLALTPLLAAVLLARPATRPGPPAPPGGDPGSSMPAVAWSAALLLAGQGVWNIAPVIVTSRLVDDPASAAGFVTAAVILRAPVLLFPSVQAFLLPAFTEMTSTGDDRALRRTVRLLGLAILVGGALWVLLAIFVVPFVAHLVFAATVTPPAWVMALLAASTAVGAIAQIGQTQLVAQRRPAAVAVAWTVGLAVLVVLALALTPVLIAGTLGQLVGAVAVLVVIALVRRPRETS